MKKTRKRKGGYDMAIDFMTGMTLTLITISMVLGILTFIGFFFAWDWIVIRMKLRFQKGSALILFFGKDNKLYFTTAKISGKKAETGQLEINGLPYTINRKKIIYHKSCPVLIFDEGVSEPLSANSGELNYGKMTPELLSQMLAMARQSGRLPSGSEKREQLMFYMAIGTIIGVGICCYLVFTMSDKVTAIQNLSKGIADALNTFFSSYPNLIGK